MNDKFRVISYDYGKTEHYYDNKLHSDDGPAVIYKGYSDIQIYYKHGVIHREDGPAIITNSNKNNFKLEWYFDGKRHRNDGPALIEGSGYMEYWNEGIKKDN
jgi:hypothetical protein